MRTPRAVFATLIVTIAFASPRGDAEDRIQLKDGNEITGSVVEYSEGTLTIAEGGKSKQIKMKEIKSVQFDNTNDAGQDKIVTRGDEEIVGTLVEYVAPAFSIRVGDKIRKIGTGKIATISPGAGRTPAAKPDRKADQWDLEGLIVERTADEIIAGIENREKAKAEAMKGLTVRFPYSRVWVPRDGESVEYSLCELFFDGREPTQGFFQIGDEPCEILVQSSDPQVVAPIRDPEHISGPYFFQFKKPGKAEVCITAGRYVAKQAFEVISAPAAVGDPTNAVIQEMGLPSHQSEVYVAWPNTESHDCFLYSPKAGEPFIGEHWFFDKYQDLILAIQDGRVVKLGTNRKRTSNQIELRIERPNN